MHNPKSWLQHRVLRATSLGIITGMTGWLAGCAQLPAAAGQDEVRELLTERGFPTLTLAQSPTTPGTTPDVPVLEPVGHDRDAGTTPVDARLSFEQAFGIALRHNPDLQTALARLGIAAADVYEAGRLTNPRLGLGYAFVSGAGLDNERSASLLQDLSAILLLPARQRLADSAFKQVQYLVADGIRQLASDLAAAMVDLAAATEQAAIATRKADAAGLAARLTERYVAAGNLDESQAARGRVDAAEAAIAALEARLTVARARADLARLLGRPLDEATQVELAGLPAPLATPPDRDDLLASARQQRLDLAAAESALAREIEALGMTRRYRYLGNIEGGIAWNDDKDGGHATGPELAIELPLFDRGQGRIARAEAGRDAATAARDGLLADISIDADLALATAAEAAARFRLLHDELLPARRALVARRQAEFNYMLSGPFDLFAARIDEYRAASALIESLRTWWIARIHLADAQGIMPPLPRGEPMYTAASLLGPANEAPPAQTGSAKPHAAMHHHHHGHANPQRDPQAPASTAPTTTTRTEGQ